MSKRILALFDVDGTLTVPRNVSINIDKNDLTYLCKSAVVISPCLRKGCHKDASQPPFYLSFPFIGNQREYD